MHHTAMRPPKAPPAGPVLAHHRRNAAETRRRQMGTGDLFADTREAMVLPEAGG